MGCDDRMLDDLDRHVETTSTKLNKAQRKLSRFVRDNQSRSFSSPFPLFDMILMHPLGSPSSWCILILIIVLTFLLITILFF